MLGIVAGMRRFPTIPTHRTPNLPSPAQNRTADNPHGRRQGRARQPHRTARHVRCWLSALARTLDTIATLATSAPVHQLLGALAPTNWQARLVGALASLWLARHDPIARPLALAAVATSLATGGGLTTILVRVLFTLLHTALAAWARERQSAATANSATPG